MSDSYTAPHPSRSVLLSIDVQADFSNPGAPAEIPGTYDRIPAMRRVMDAYRQAKRPIVHVIRLYQADGANADLCRKEMIERGVSIVTPGSSGAEIAESMKPKPAARLDPDRLFAGEFQELGQREWAMYKPRWDAFHQTRLDERLRALGVDTVVVMGCNFPNCPRATLYGASMRDYRVAIVADAVSGIYDRGIEELRGIGIAILQSEEIPAWLSQSAKTELG